MFTRVLVASQSTLKYDAVVVAIEANLASEENSKCVFAQKYDVLRTSADVGATTNCPQPVGEISARYCAQKRIDQIDCLSDSNNSLIVVIENYIHCDGPGFPWVDRCFVRLVYPSGSVCASSMQDVEVPQKYDPQGEPDIAQPLGYSETVGERIHRDYKTVSSKDWFRAASSTNPTRSDIIVDTLKRCFVQLAEQRCLRQQFVQYTDFPKPGVLFDDMFGALATLHGCSKMVKTLVSQIDAVLGPVALEKNDSFGAPSITSQESWNDKYFIVGLESRGLMLGAMLAARLGTAFVPIRKPGKLPGSFIADTFEKEYGPDNCEMQTSYLSKVPKRAIIVDDVLATGGSMAAACRLVKRSGKEISLILSLVGVAHLRKQRATALKPFTSAGTFISIALTEEMTCAASNGKRNLSGATIDATTEQKRKRTDQ